MASKHEGSPQIEKPSKKSKPAAARKLDPEKEMDTSEASPANQDKVVQLLEKLSADISQIDEKITSLDGKFGAMVLQLKAAENRISTVEDTVQNLTLENNKLSRALTGAMEKISDLENRSRRGNLRIYGFPEEAEQGNPISFLEHELPKILGMQPGTIEIERAHRSLNPKPKPGVRPRPFIINLLRYPIKEKIMAIARGKKELKWGQKDHKIMIFQDYSKDVIEKRQKCNDAKRLARNKNLDYFISYPAVFKVRSGGKLHSFTCHQEAEKFITSA